MLTLDVDGMTCMGCVRSVKAALEKADPSAKVEIDLASGRVEIEGAIAAPAARQAIEAAGFDVRG
ncbi:heavy-metal-associated domain-containing protein [Siculibacillus lacustris]|uniref:Heavy-metal-associated domain-containing protein n=1 Tax=Siculibacillus lacustris TaxID=1549641 RepID=A0A4Q9VNJ1_9HYPH|nr:heavy metal-associated domain-containing protein [Siculibacillus lacustris]TBW37228.1 heavy-metal-associated domain-containing protein [Siculibacillus lacustris]